MFFVEEVASGEALITPSDGVITPSAEEGSAIKPNEATDEPDNDKRIEIAEYSRKNKVEVLDI